MRGWRRACVDRQLESINHHDVIFLMIISSCRPRLGARVLCTGTLVLRDVHVRER